MRAAPGPLMPSILHLVTATLRAEAPAAAVGDAVAAARDLRAAPGVETVLVGRSDAQLVVATWLTGAEALDAFAESRLHMQFIMRGLAPVIRGMWSAAVETEGTPLPAAELLWVFVLPATEDVYEWQVRALLAEAEQLPGVASVGRTVEERERYRAGGIVCVGANDRNDFEATLLGARETWTGVVGALEEALVMLLPA